MIQGTFCSSNGAPRGHSVERLHRTQMRTGDRIDAHRGLALPDGQGVVGPANPTGLARINLEGA